MDDYKSALIQSHKDLRVWRLSVDLAVDVYRLTDGFPKSEAYGLTSQIRRCVVSIPSNMAEGAARNTRKDYVRFLYIARASIAELQTQLSIAERLGYQENFAEIEPGIRTIFQMTNALIRSLRST